MCARQCARHCAPNDPPACPAWGEGRCAADAGFVCAGDAHCRRDCFGRLMRVQQCLSKTKMKADLASRFTAPAISFRSSRKVTPCHHLPRTKTFRCAPEATPLSRLGVGSNWSPRSVDPNRRQCFA